MANRAVADSVDGLVQEAAVRLIEAAKPTRLILFGSHAHGHSDKDSDLDFLVIVPQVVDRASEILRLRRVLASIPMPIDILLYTEEEVAYRGHLPDTALRSALAEGIVLHGAREGNFLKEQPGMPLGDWARELRRKAAEDEYAAAKLAEDPTVAEAIVLFHYQQAAEKFLKAVLVNERIEFPRTHDLEELIRLLEDGGTQLPAGIEQVGRLTPFAVEPRYRDIAIRVDRKRAEELVAGLRQWADREIGTGT